MNLETSIVQQIRLAAAPSILWRNNSGSYIKDGYFIRYGVGQPGGSDLIGLTPVTVTKQMVGSIVAIFTAIEVKIGTGKISTDQNNFINVVLSHGGIAGIARSAVEAQALIRGF